MHDASAVPEVKSRATARAVVQGVPVKKNTLYLKTKLVN